MLIKAEDELQFMQEEKPIQSSHSRWTETKLRVFWQTHQYSGHWTAPCLELLLKRGLSFNSQEKIVHTSHLLWTLWISFF